MTDKMLPCPFCYSTKLGTYVDEKCHYRPACYNCGAGKGFYATQDEAIAAWNTRATQPVDVEALKREIADKIGCTHGDLTLHDTIDHLAANYNFVPKKASGE